MYKLLLNDQNQICADRILRTVDNAFIPNDMDNRDWREYQAWLSLGNTPIAAE